MRLAERYAGNKKLCMTATVTEKSPCTRQAVLDLEEICRKKKGIKKRQT